MPLVKPMSATALFWSRRGWPRIALICTATLGLGCVTAWSAPRKSASVKTPAVERQPLRAPAETVYVATAPPPAPASPAPLFSQSSSVSSRDAEGRRNRAEFSTGPNKDYGQAYGIFGGFYNAEVLGNNPYANIYWDIYPGVQPYFFEFTAGIGTVQSDLAKKIIGASYFTHSYLIIGEALGGYTYSGLAKGPGLAGGLYPYFTGGITALYQGGVPNIGAVIGFGNRMILPYGPKNGRWALNYGLRDQIYSQKLNSRPSMTQTLVMLVGVQKYY